MSIAPSCHADTILRGTAQPITIVRWHLHRGTHRYYIVGPGGTAMHPCSEPDYVGRHPTIQPREAAIARAAIADLNQRFRDNRDAGPEEIKQALALADASIPLHHTTITDLSDISEESDPEPIADEIPAKAVPPQATPEDIKAIIAAVEFETGIPAAHFWDGSDLIRYRSAKNSRARAMCFVVARTLYPSMHRYDADKAFGRCKGTASQHLIRHDAPYSSEPEYSATLATIIAKLTR